VNTARKGRRLEHHARALLEAQGYVVVRAAGSKGPADLVGVGPADVVLVSVKAGGRYLSAVERATFTAWPVPPGVRKEVWRFVDGDRTPRIERV
jgi:Holliday junction resolvase